LDGEAPATEPSIPLYPIFKLAGPDRFRQVEFFTPKPVNSTAETFKFDHVDLASPISDDIVPIIFGEQFGSVFLRSDIAARLRPQLAPSQRLVPARCEDEPFPYFALADTAPRVWLHEDWTSVPCSERSALEFHDGHTVLTPIFPDNFSSDFGGHFVGHYGNFFLDINLWRSLCKEIPAVSHWLDASRIVVEDACS
jgi:hypothetical protein